MRDRAYVEDLVLGQKYIESNEYHHECEYGEIWYVGTSYNKWGDLIYCFSEEEIDLPDDYDGDADSIFFGGPVFEEVSVEGGAIAMADEE